jgi:enoyl-CoA hydratase/carnithine racemase
MLDKYNELSTLQVEQDGRLLSVTLNRPESLNAVGGGMHEQLEELWALVRRDASVGGVLLKGAGRAFCAGGDVKGMAASADSERAVAPSTANMLIGAKTLIANMLEVEQPIVAAVHGYAMGLGATIALCSDVVIAADDAILADTHVSIGLVAGDGGAVIWPLLLPINTAKYYLMTGDRITGQEAARLGLVLRSVPADRLAAEAQAVARKLANGPSMAIRFTKTSVNKILRERMNLLLDTSLILEGVTMYSADHREATQAFVEKREPVYTGQ